MKIGNANYEPKAYLSYRVEAQDADGNPTQTCFYKNSDYTGLQFTWNQTWNDSGVCISFQIVINEA